MQQFILSKCSRKNQTRVCLKCCFLYKMYFKNLWFVLLKSKLMLSQIHVLGGSSIAGLGNMRGGGFVFFKHYHRQCNRWLDYVASYPSKPNKFSISVFPFDFVLIFCCSFLLTASGTWHFIIVYMYIEQVMTWHWPPSYCWGVLIWFFLLGLMSYSSQSEAFCVNETNCVNVWWKRRNHWVTHLS